MARGGGVEDDGFVGQGFDLFEDFGKGHGLVNTGNLGGEMSVYDFLCVWGYIVWGHTANARSCIIPPIPAAGPSPSSA